MEIKIIRTDLGNSSLEVRTYEALRKSKLPFSAGEWNQHGRRYNVRGLYNLINTPGIFPQFEDSIEKDIREYTLLKNSRRQ